MSYLYLKNVIILFNLLIINTINTIIVRGELLRKKHPDGEYHYVYAFSDMHYINLEQNFFTTHQLNVQDLSEETELQRDKFVQYVSSLRQDKIKILVEDTYTHGVTQPSLTPIVAKGVAKPYFDLLFPQNNIGLAYYLINKKLNVVNTDFRQNYMATYTYFSLINNLSEKITQEHDCIIKNYLCNSFQALLQELPYYDFPIKKYAELFDDTLYKIRTYRDGDILTTYYSNESDHVQQLGRKTLAKMRSSSQDVSFINFIFQLIKEKKELNFLTAYPISYAANFLDMITLHEIYQSFEKKDTETIFFIAGAGHVNNVCDKLLEIGYERVAEEGVTDKEIKIISSLIANKNNLDDIMDMPASKLKNYFINDITTFTNLIIKTLNKRPPFDMDFLHLH